MSTAIISSSLFKDINLKNYWRFDGDVLASTGSTDGTNVGSVGFGTGKYGQAVGPFASGKNVTVGTSMLTRATAGTITTWVYLNSNGIQGGVNTYSYSSIYCRGGAYSVIEILDTNKIRMYHYNGTSGLYYDSNNAIATGSWQMVTYTWSNSAASKIYLNGELDASSSLSFYNVAAAADAEVVDIGNMTWNGKNSYIPGYLDDYAFFNRELTRGEVSSLYLEYAIGTPIISGSLFKDQYLKYYYQLDGNSIATTGSQNGTDINMHYSKDYGIFDTTSTITLGTIFPPRGVDGTISAWIYLVASGTTGIQEYQFSSYYTKGEVYGRLGVTAGNKVRAYTYTGATTYQTSNKSLENNKWYHIAYTWNSVSASIYINGVKDSGSGSGNMYNMDSPGDAGIVYLGLGNEPNAVPFQGMLEELALFNKELTPTEIYNLYTSSIDIPTIPVRQQMQMIL